MLQALSGVQPDLSSHTIITAIGGLAWRLCGSVMNNGGHEGHCALEKHLIPTDGPVSWGTDWSALECLCFCSRVSQTTVHVFVRASRLS